ncbi:hypothetical protein AU15_05185 [Marinobacter salarius]|uniref:Uncharacterized protein n=1 Tax=Marinobacter salarius TaxID=1420917 RepID=W5YVE7_9GAMM|nr:hypothetical protein AU15_05185 [Marinobacter salarius]
MLKCSYPRQRLFGHRQQVVTISTQHQTLRLTPKKPEAKIIL